MRMVVFTGNAMDYENAALEAQDKLIDYCKANFIHGNEVISLAPTVLTEPVGYTISLWLLLK